jgi:predicted KAP-like P-loop ATPase
MLICLNLQTVVIMNNDKPINNKKEDKIERSRFAEKLVEEIYAWEDPDTSLVIGIYAKWGEGKTSFLNLIKEQIEKNSENTKPLIIQFNPWEYKETKNLLNPFIHEVISKLKPDKSNKKLIKKLEYYTQVVNCIFPNQEQYLNFISGILFFTVTIGGFFTNFGQKFINSIFTRFFYCLILAITVFLKPLCNTIITIFNINKTYTTKTPEELKKEIRQLLINKKLVIIIDDIDRLSTSEIKQIIKIVKNNANFPNTIYLLAFDREIIEKSLSVQQGVDGHCYLEKIVNFPYDLEPPPPALIKNYFYNQLDDFREPLKTMIYTVFLSEK